MACYLNTLTYDGFLGAEAVNNAPSHLRIGDIWSTLRGLYSVMDGIHLLHASTKPLMTASTQRDGNADNLSICAGLG